MMSSTSIIPHNHVAKAPFVPIYEFLIELMLENGVQDGSGLIIRHTLYADGEPMRYI